MLRSLISFSTKAFLSFFLIVPLTLSISYGSTSPSYDHQREWTAVEYADSIIVYTKDKYPDLKLSVDLNDLTKMTFLDKSDDQKLKERVAEAHKMLHDPALLKMPLHFRLMNSFRHLIGSDLQKLLYLLEFGLPIPYRKSSASDESQLAKWLLEQPDGSVYPHQFMAEAIRLTEGRMIAAWALAWNVTNRDWTGTPLRNYDAKIGKFVSMTGERDVWSGGVNYIVLPEKDWTTVEAQVVNLDSQESTVQSIKRIGLAISKRGDEFSYLYHRIGVELLAMVVSKTSGRPFLGNLVGKVGAVGEWLKYMQTSGLASENEKRVSNDVVAAQSGSRLFSLVERNAKTSIHEIDLSKAVPYFKSNPEKFDSDYRLPVGRPAWYFKSETDPKFWAPSMSLEELEYRFYHATHVDSGILNPVVLLANGEYERLHRGLTDYLESRQSLEKLNTYLQSYLSGVRASPVKSEFENQDNDLSATGKNLSRAQAFYPGYKFEEATLRIKRLITRVLLAKQSKSLVLPQEIDKKQPKAFSCEQILTTSIRK